MKRRSLTLTICILAVLALASIGFASWIITNPNAGTEAPGTIAVDDVTSEVFKIETKWDTTSGGKINFGKPKNYTEQETDWLTNNATDEENLEAELTISFNKADNVNLEAILSETPIEVTFGVVKNNADLSDTDAEALFTGLNLPYPVLTIKDSTGAFVAFDGTIDYADLDSNAQCVIKVTFAWGVSTNNVNPYVYYNTIDFGTETNEVDDEGNKLAIEVVAEKYLNSLYTEFQGVSYKLTLKEGKA